MSNINSVEIVIPKIGFSNQVFTIFVDGVKNEKFKKAFIRGLIGVSLTGVLVFFGGKLKRAVGCPIPENVYEIRQKRTWYQWSKSFLTLEIAGRFFGICTGLILLRAVHNLDFEIKKSAKLKADLDHATAYIQLLIQSCVEWKDPNK
jgi:hypothetical protein